MRKPQAIPAASTLAIVMLAAFWTGSASADFTYQVTVDTSSLNGQAGYLDFQLNPGDSSAEAVTGVITNFQSAGAHLAPSSTLTGDASGVLPGNLTLDNVTVYNDIFQGLTYGTNISYDVTFSGPALNSPGGSVGSSFAFALYDSSGTIPQLTTDPNGSVLSINVNFDGTTSVETFPQSPANSTPVASATPLVNSVPEPPSIVLFLFAVPPGLIYWRRSK